MSVKLSVIIPCFNESKNLEKLVNRIKIDLKKVDYFVEVILVNNGSIDDSQMKIEELLKQSRSIKVVNLVNNIGILNGGFLFKISEIILLCSEIFN